MKSVRLWPAQTAACGVVLVFGLLSRLPAQTLEEKTALAQRFSFERVALPTTPAPKTKTVLPVNPQIAHIARWISAVGTSAALGDIDEDGIANDLCYVEPRSGEIIVSPIPGTSERFPLFVLDTSPPIISGVHVPTGCKIGDFNEDGWADLLVHFIGRTPVLFLRRGDGGNPSALSLSAFQAQNLVEKDEPWWTSTIFQGDIDGDGHTDLVVGNYFPDGEEIFGAQAKGPVHMHETFARARNGGKNRVFLWAGGESGASPRVTFKEAENPFPDDDATAWTLAVGGADLNKDGLVELYFANDFGPDQLYLNTSKPGKLSLVRLHGDKGFTIPTSRVLGNDSFKGMGVDFGDINGDGWFDLFVSNITVHGGLEESHFLFLSDGRVQDMHKGRAPYRDEGERLGVSRSSWAWDSRFADFDNDGELELMQATGFIKGRINWWADLAEFANANDQMVQNPANWPSFPEDIDISGHDKEPFYVKGTGGTYVDISTQVGFDGAYNSRGLSIGDVDADGDLDLVLSNQWEDSWLFRNGAKNENRFLGLRLMLSAEVQETKAVKGAVANASTWPALGAFATVQLPSGKTLIRQIDGGSGHSGACAQEMLFGLGNVPADQPLSVHLRWRDRAGAVQETELKLSPGWYTVTLANGRGQEKK